MVVPTSVSRGRASRPAPSRTWHRGHDEVSVEGVIAVIQSNVVNAQRILRGAVRRIAAHDGPAPHSNALQYAVITRPEAMRADTRERLALLLDKVVE